MLPMQSDTRNFKYHNPQTLQPIIYFVLGALGIGVSVPPASFLRSRILADVGTLSLATEFVGGVAGSWNMVPKLLGVHGVKICKLSISIT